MLCGQVMVQIHVVMRLIRDVVFVNERINLLICTTDNKYDRKEYDQDHRSFTHDDVCLQSTLSYI